MGVTHTSELDQYELDRAALGLKPMSPERRESARRLAAFLDGAVPELASRPYDRPVNIVPLK